MRKLRAWPLALAALLALLGGCASGPVLYASNYPVNLHIRVKKLKSDRVELVSTFKARLLVGSMDRHCRGAYLGSVPLEAGKETAIGLPAGRTSALVVEFSTGSRFIYAPSSSTAYKTLFRPLPGRSYDMDVSYDSGAYEVNIYERRGRARHLVEPRPFSACRKSPG